MQANFIQGYGKLASISKKSIIGDVTQVRHHVKMYPWRKVRCSRESYLDNTKTPYTDRLNMNEFDKEKRQKKPWMQVIPKDKDNRFNAYKWNENYKSNPIEARETAESKLNRFRDSLKNRGSARETRSYEPPEGVQELILSLYRESTLNDPSQTTVSSNEEILNINLNQNTKFKFNLISKCIEAFQHDLPTSWLNDVESINDLVNYFSTPVRGVNPYTAMVRQQNALPENLYLIPEPVRYDRENDIMFKGHTALPGIVNKIPGLRAKDKSTLR